MVYDIWNHKIEKNVVRNSHLVIQKSVTYTDEVTAWSWLETRLVYSVAMVQAQSTEMASQGK